MKYNKKEVNEVIKGLEIGQSFKIINPKPNEINAIRQDVTAIKKKTGLVFKVNKSGENIIVTRIESKYNLGYVLSNMSVGDELEFTLDKYDTLRTYSKRYSITVSKRSGIVKVIKL